MKLSYDPKHNIAYIRLKEKIAEVETVHVSDSINVDLTPDGTVYGIELLNANEQLKGKEKEADRLILENLSTGASATINLPM